MKFTVLSHAGLYVEARGTSLIIDPWIVGSCYWRSWWNYPKPAPFASRLETLDYIYLTHLHWDHFHGPSLRKLPKDATLLIPEAHFDRFKKDSKGFRFKEIVEVPHAKTIQLGNGVDFTTYQYSLFTDSAVVVDDGETTLLDLNDCKITGMPLDQLRRHHPKIDFVFRSHSSASAYPQCVDAEDADGGSYRSKEDYMSEFVDTARLLEPRYAIPFASSHCFLHKDTIQYNVDAVSPADVDAYFEQHGPTGSECKVMVSGDSWDSQAGFDIADNDWWSNKDTRVAEYAEEIAPKLRDQYALEDRTSVKFPRFAKYFQAQIESLPKLSRKLFKPVVVYGLPGRDDIHWVVDYDQRKVYESDALPDHWAVRVVMPPIVLRDCLYKKMFSCFSASKRLHVTVRSGHMRDYFILFQLLDMYEYEYFPLRNCFRWRFIKVWLRRWREVIEYFKLLSSIALGRGDDPLSKFVPKVDTGSDPG